MGSGLVWERFLANSTSLWALATRSSNKDCNTLAVCSVPVMYLACFGSFLLSLLSLFRGAGEEGLRRVLESLGYARCLVRGTVNIDFNEVGHVLVVKAGQINYLGGSILFHLRLATFGSNECIRRVSVRPVKIKRKVKARGSLKRWLFTCRIFMVQNRTGELFLFFLDSNRSE